MSKHWTAVDNRDAYRCTTCKLEMAGHQFHETDGQHICRPSEALGNTYDNFAKAAHARQARLDGFAAQRAQQVATARAQAFMLGADPNNISKPPPVVLELAEAKKQLESALASVESLATENRHLEKSLARAYDKGDELRKFIVERNLGPHDKGYDSNPKLINGRWVQPGKAGCAHGVELSAPCQSCASARRLGGSVSEMGPGIAALQKPDTSLYCLDEDLLCEDA